MVGGRLGISEEVSDGVALGTNVGTMEGATIIEEGNAEGC